MRKKDLYKRIKSVLLRDENIARVSINSVRGIVKVCPSKDKFYVLVSDPLKNFKMDNYIVICDTHFKICNYVFNADKFELQLREIS